MGVFAVQPTRPKRLPPARLSGRNALEKPGGDFHDTTWDVVRRPRVAVSGSGEVPPPA